MPAAPRDPFVFLGVMTNPDNAARRTDLRLWASHFNGTTRQAFVVGGSYFGGNLHGSPAERLADERTKHKDDFFVLETARERLPHIGVVTEKSAEWWLTAAAREPRYTYYCKSDDDTLVHHDRLEVVLRQLEREMPGRAVYFGHMKWRGWEPHHRFQACGGGWGDAKKTADDILRGGILHGTTRYPPCPYAAGPYPYMSGGMVRTAQFGATRRNFAQFSDAAPRRSTPQVCMSRAMALQVAADEGFRSFYRVAQQRNTAGTPCKHFSKCASQPPDVHMWHHEDAGVGFNVFRAAVAANASATFVPVPAHYNDPGVIERSTSAQDEYWSTRSLFVHGIKTHRQYNLATSKWALGRPTAALEMRCKPCSEKGTNLHYGKWTYARLPCPLPAAEAAAADHQTAASPPPWWCEVQIDKHFTCCGFPWTIPEEMTRRERAERAARRAAKKRGVAR